VKRKVVTSIFSTWERELLTGCHNGLVCNSLMRVEFHAVMELYVNIYHIQVYPSSMHAISRFLFVLLQIRH